MQKRLRRSQLENVAIANALQLEAARTTQPLSALITTPCQVRCALPNYSVFAVDTLLYDVNFTFDPVTLTFDL